MNSAVMLTSATTPPTPRIDAVRGDKNLLERFIPFLVFSFSLAYLCIPLRYCSMEPDEGIVLQGAERVLHGQLPYRDFFTFYTPGSFYSLAWWFRLFGDSYAAARFSIAITGAICSSVTYVLARRVCGRGISLMAAILATMVGTGFRFLVLHNWYSTLFCCLGPYFALRFAESAKARFLLLATASASLTVLFEQSKGAGLCIGLFAGLLLLQLAGRIHLFKWLPATAAFGGFVLPFLVVFSFFGAHGALGVMLQSWLWPLGHYTQANHVPYGYQNWSEATRLALFRTGPLWLRAMKLVAVSPDFIIPALPLIGLALFIYFSVQTLKKSALAASAASYILVSSVASGLLVSVLISRADILHFIYLSPILYVILAWILGSSQFSSRLLHAARPYLALYVATAFGLLGFAILLQARGAHQRIETRRGAVMSSGKDSVIDYVQTHVPSGRNFLVYPYLPLYNYLTATTSPTPYDYFQPGMNTQEQAHEIVASLSSQHIQAVLFEPSFAEKIADSWPGTPLQMIASDPVADFISRNYRVCQMLNSASGWRFEYMTLRGHPCETR